MRKLLISTATITLLAAAPALAAAPDFKTVDADGNGSVSFEELIVVMPDTSKEQFAAVDLDKSGELSMEEYIAATKS
ncbi:EF-hand domain-containing protein [Sneathiella sp. CAU 1612]|uniref:EF-hand domain-containing protein n=1 Tax=Sneathiella sedimenti TaxID=2816034 RepID=A0ABS3F130_9PROT|nr:EF-hand domain-containing protein [Sneathiella sedimenti]MBO0332072.1 EF-hand domain-containing protein [Sneathiella sedimenti]